MAYDYLHSSIKCKMNIRTSHGHCNTIVEYKNLQNSKVKYKNNTITRDCSNNVGLIRDSNCTNFMHNQNFVPTFFS